MIKKNITPIIGEDGFYHYLYKTTNLVTERFYIGIHKSKEPLDKYYYGSGVELNDDIQEIGKEWFSVEPLQYFTNRTECENMERKIVNKYFVETNQTYNLRGGGSGSSYFTEEFKKRMSKKKRGSNAYWYGKSLNEEHRKKISESKKGKPCSEETKEKISSTNKGRKGYWTGKQHYEETKKKMSEAKKGAKHPFYEKTHSEETKRKISDARKKYWEQKRSL